MRRPPEVGLVLLSLLASLPAVSGCAGVTQRLSLSSPVLSGSDGTEVGAPSRTAWWRGSAAGSSTESTPSVTATGIEPLPAGVVGSPDVWPESQSEWLARRFPLLSRAWNRNASGDQREGVDPSVRTQTSQVSTRSATTRNPSSSRADEDIRPVQASSDDDTASNGATAGLGQRQRNGRQRLAEPPVAADRPHSLPESSGAVELDVSNAVAAGSEDHSSGEAHPAPAAALQPEQGSPVASRSDSEIPGPVSVPDQAGTVSPAAAGVLSPEQSGPFRLLAMAPYNGSLMWPALNPEPETPTALARAANPSAETASGAAQDPPAPAPPAQPTTPPAPPIPSDDRPAAAPTQPEAPAPSEPSAPEPQPSPATAPASGAPPAASPAPAQVPAATADQGLLAATPQSIYASPPPVAAPEPRGRFLSWLHPDRKATPLASSQLPPATFPTTYKHASPCVQPVSIAQTTQSAPCATAVKAPKKPCILTTLFVKLKGLCHGAGCDKCRKSQAPSCCHDCPCCSRKHAAVAPSPQGPATTPQGPVTDLQSAPASSNAQVRSAGTEPGDVAQRGDVVDSAVSQGGDETPQR